MPPTVNYITKDELENEEMKSSTQAWSEFHHTTLSLFIGASRVSGRICNPHYSPLRLSLNVPKCLSTAKLSNSGASKLSSPFSG